MALRTRHIVSKHGPHPIDVHVGSRLRLRRTLLGMNQTQLGEKLGVPFQRIYTYERGSTRISASQLYQFSRILGVQVLYFFDGLDEGDSTRPSDDILLKRETLEFVRAYFRIGDPAAREIVFKLTMVMANLA